MSISSSEGTTVQSSPGHIDLNVHSHISPSRDHEGEFIHNDIIMSSAKSHESFFLTEPVKGIITTPNIDPSSFEVPPRVDYRVIEEMKKTPILEDVITSVMMSLGSIIRRNELLKDIHLHYRVHIIDDIEFPDWKKVFFTFFIDDDDIQRKFRMWDVLDDFMRTSILRVKKDRYSHGENSKKIDEINQNIYTDIHLEKGDAHVRSPRVLSSVKANL